MCLAQGHDAADAGEARTPLYIQSGFTSPWQQQIDVDAASGINCALILFTQQSVGQKSPRQTPLLIFV